MSQNDGGQPVVVNVGACRCPGTPHTPGDTVTLRGGLTTPMGVAGWAALREGGDSQTIQGNLAAAWLRFGIVAWSFLDEKGQPVPITPENIERMLPFAHGGFEVANVADDLYAEDLFRPLASRMSTSSPATSTESSTSASPPSSDSLPEPSSPSPLPARHGKPSAVPAR